MKRRIAKKLLIAKSRAYRGWWYGSIPREMRVAKTVIMRDFRKGKLKWAPPHWRDVATRPVDDAWATRVARALKAAGERDDRRGESARNSKKPVGDASTRRSSHASDATFRASGTDRGFVDDARFALRLTSQGGRRLQGRLSGQNQSER
jgi:hypothetical protein